MGISNDNYVIKGLSGTVGTLFTFRQRGGKTIVQKVRRPTSIPPTEKLKSLRKNFASCIAYAKTVIKNPELKAAYQAAAKGGQTAFNVATSDALNPPEIKSINTTGYQGNPGDPIRIHAIDDFKVAGLKISIYLATGELLEQGNAILQEGDGDWLYVATEQNPVLAGSRVTATVMDLPGNTSSESIMLS